MDAAAPSLLASDDAMAGPVRVPPPKDETVLFQVHWRAICAAKNLRYQENALFPLALALRVLLQNFTGRNREN